LHQNRTWQTGFYTSYIQQGEEHRSSTNRQGSSNVSSTPISSGILRIAIIFLLIMIFGTISTVLAAPSSKKVREDGILGIFLGPLPSGRQVCNGSSVPLTFFVKNISPGLEVPIRVVEAGVTVSGNQGITKDMLTVQVLCASLANIQRRLADP
jgi:hypothetical protein